MSNRVDVDRIMRYEAGEMGENEMINLFQDLVDCGMAWQLQGHYGRTATRLLEAGIIFPNLESH